MCVCGGGGIGGSGSHPQGPLMSCIVCVVSPRIGEHA